MSLKRLSLFPILVILLAVPLAIFETDLAYASGTIYILQDGTINPSTANITSTDNQTYVFTGNVNDSIVIQRSNIILDGAGYSLTALTSDQAIYMYLLTNVKITNVMIQQSKIGILFENCSFCEVTSSQITGSSNQALLIDGSFNNTIDSNSFENSYRGIELTNGAQYNTISHNYIAHNGVGVELEQYSSGNIILANYIVENSGHGIAIGTWSSSNTIDGNHLTNNIDTGLSITQSPNCVVTYNAVSGNYYGICLMYVNMTLLRNNQMYNNHYNFALYFNKYSDFLNDVDATNTVNFKPIYYWVDKHGLTVPNDAGIILLHECSDILVQDLGFTDTVWQAVVIGYSANITVTNCHVESAGNQTEYCIQLWNATNCMLDQNYLHGSVGIRLDYSSNNTIYNNTLTGSSNLGAIAFRSSENNLFYHNNFINNYIDVLADTISSNQWDNGYPDGGNYWDKYLEQMGSNARDNFSGPNQDQPGADDFWDIAYPINNNNTDHYPLVPEYSTLILFASFISITAITAITVRRKPRARSV